MSEPEKCLTCGRASRIEAGYTLQDVEFPDAYCGFCGVNWGVYVEKVAEQLRGKPKVQWKPMTRLGR